jgi:hypothetical protein
MNAVPIPLRTWRSPRLLAAATLSVALVGSAIALGSGVIRLPVLQPSPYTQATIAPSQSSALVEALIAYTRETEIWPSTCPTTGFGVRCPEAHYARQLWTIGADGSDPHSVFPDRPDAVIGLIGWSADGTRLLFSEDGGRFQVDPSGAHLERLGPIETGCTLPCTGDGLASLSADGSKVVFVRTLAAGASVVAWMDVASHHVVELDSTLTTTHMREPRWSPDGTQIVYSTSGKFNEDSVALVVAADGGNLHRLNPVSLPARSPAWSADGTLIVLSSFEERTVSVPGDPAHAVLVRNIYTVRPDGTELRALTTDGVARGATWTPGGRILFVRVPLDAGNSPTRDPSSGFWTMAFDGGDLLQIPGSATAVTPDTWSDDSVAFWQPTP